MSGTNTKDQDPPRQEKSRAQFLWPLVRGKDVNRFSLEESGLYAVLPHDPKDLRKVLSLEDLAKIRPRSLGLSRRVDSGVDQTVTLRQASTIGGLSLGHTRPDRACYA